MNYNFENPIIFCDESGYSGSLKINSNIDHYLKQPLFVTVGIKITSEKEYERLTKKYQEFKIKYGYEDAELKDLTAPKNNDMLIDFIDNFINEESWFLSIIDKKYDIFFDALRLIMPKKIWIQDLLEIVEINIKSIDVIVNSYSNLLKNRNLEEYYQTIKNEINFLIFENKTSFKNLEDNFNSFIETKKIINFSHLTSLEYLIDLIFGSWEIEKFFTNNKIDTTNFTIYYDKNEEFEQNYNNIENKNDYITIDENNINFIDSKNEILIQLADNYARVFQAFFSGIFNKEENQIDFKRIFHNLYINYFKRASIQATNINKSIFIKPDKDYWNMFKRLYNTIEESKK